MPEQPGSQQPTAQEQPELTYEEAYAQLEEILNALESRDLPLEESLKLYELGAQLAAYCTHKLDEAELRVRKWQPTQDAEMDGESDPESDDDSLADFEDWQEP